MKTFRVLAAISVFLTSLIPAIPAYADNENTYTLILRPNIDVAWVQDATETQEQFAQFPAASGYPYAWLADNSTSTGWNTTNSGSSKNITGFIGFANIPAEGISITGLTLTQVTSGNASGDNAAIYYSMNSSDTYNVTHIETFQRTSLSPVSNSYNIYSLFGYNTVNCTKTGVDNFVLKIKHISTGNPNVNVRFYEYYLTVTYTRGTYVSPSIAANEIMANAENTLDSVGWGSTGGKLFAGILISIIIALICGHYLGAKFGMFTGIAVFVALLLGGFFDAVAVLVIALLCAFAVWIGLHKLLEGKKKAA